MYKVTIAKKGSYESVALKYESRADAFVTIENILDGDINTEYECKIEIVEEGEE